MPPSPGDADAELLRRHVAGDPDAFAILFRTHADRLWSVSYRLLRNAEDAADAVQEAMLAAHRRAAGFRGEASVATWLHRIVVNAALDRLRRRSARPTVPLPIGPDGAPLDPADPRDAIAEGDTRLDVGAALALLPDPLRAAVVLVDVEGRPVAEVAALLGVPVGTVKSRCALARARLAVLLGHLHPGNHGDRRSVSEVGPPHGAAPLITRSGRGRDQAVAGGYPPSPRTGGVSADPDTPEEVIGGAD
jgi:RNA polymerase sigma-70 factor, ECF subfamily